MINHVRPRTSDQSRSADSRERASGGLARSHHDVERGDGSLGFRIVEGAHHSEEPAEGFVRALGKWLKAVGRSSRVVGWFSRPACRVLSQVMRRLPPSRRPMLLAVWVDNFLKYHPVAFEVTVPDGFVINGTTEDYIQRRVFEFGCWEPVIARMIRDRLEPGDTFIDIGANIGMHTLVASQCVGDQGCVVAIEPYWPSAQALRRNVSMSANDNVRIVEVAVGDRAERRVMDSFAGNIGMARLSPRNDRGEGEPSAVVPVLPLSQIVTPQEWRTCRLVKIDVEGAEFAVVSGLADLLNSCRPDLELLVEVGPRLVRLQGDDAAALVSLLQDAGFRSRVIRNEYSISSYCATPDLTLDDLETLPSYQVDLLFTRTHPIGST